MKRKGLIIIICFLILANPYIVNSGIKVVHRQANTLFKDYSSQTEILKRNNLAGKKNPVIKGTLAVDEKQMLVILRKIKGMPLTITNYKGYVDTEFESVLCTGWKWKSRKEVTGILLEPIELNGASLEFFEIPLNNNFTFKALFTTKEYKAKLVLEGLDSLGRKVTAVL
jgi:hypothetical protein